MDDKFGSTIPDHVDIVEFDFESRDDREMAMLGKKQQLKVSIGLPVYHLTT